MTIMTARALGLGFWLFNNQNVGPKYTLVKSAIIVPQVQSGIMFSPSGQMESIKLNKTILADEEISLDDI